MKQVERRTKSASKKVPTETKEERHFKQRKRLRGDEHVRTGNHITIEQVHQRWSPVDRDGNAIVLSTKGMVVIDERLAFDAKAVAQRFLNSQPHECSYEAWADLVESLQVKPWRPNGTTPVKSVLVSRKGMDLVEELFDFTEFM